MLVGHKQRELRMSACGKEGNKIYNVETGVLMETLRAIFPLCMVLVGT